MRGEGDAVGAVHVGGSIVIFSAPGMQTFIQGLSPALGSQQTLNICCSLRDVQGAFLVGRPALALSSPCLKPFFSL